MKAIRAFSSKLLEVLCSIFLMSSNDAIGLLQVHYLMSSLKRISDHIAVVESSRLERYIFLAKDTLSFYIFVGTICFGFLSWYVKEHFFFGGMLIIALHNSIISSFLNDVT